MFENDKSEQFKEIEFKKLNDLSTNIRSALMIVENKINTNNYKYKIDRHKIEQIRKKLNRSFEYCMDLVEKIVKDIESE